LLGGIAVRNGNAFLLLGKFAKKEQAIARPRRLSTKKAWQNSK
jgi:hypothetical protein